VRPPVGYFGSKIRAAPTIIDLLPPHRAYVEPFAGSLAVLLAKSATALEVVNDIDQHLMTFWRVLRAQPAELARACALTPHSRAELADAWPIPPDVTDDVERARRVFVALTQGRGRQLRDASAGWRHHLIPGDSLPAHLARYVERVAPAAERLAHVTLECLPALDVVEKYGQHADTLLYVDPPYLHGLRKSGMYAHEMTPEDHRALAAALAGVPAAVVVSGYPDVLYDAELYAGWHRVEIPSGTGQAAHKGYQPRTEVLWCNRPFAGPKQLELLAGGGA
jgi:DNA adenine methylase